MSHDRQTSINPVEAYYRFHSKIYDFTRWSFLFGRKQIIQEVSEFHTPTCILEVGCGTGKNLVHLCRTFPDAVITGLDLSDAMLAVAQKHAARFRNRVTLLSLVYNHPLKPERSFDLILFSYSLSMFNPGWKEAIEYASQDLASGGLIAVVDFHDSRLPGFKWWMQLNHVRLEGHLLPELQHRFQPKSTVIGNAYGGIWEYLKFIGEKV